MGCRETVWLTMVFITGCRGKSSTWSTFSHSLFTDLGVCRIVSLTSSYSSLYPAVPQQLFRLLKYIITEALPLSLIGTSLGQWRSILEPAAIDSIRHGGSFSQLLTEAIPIAPRYQNLAMQTHNKTLMRRLIKWQQMGIQQ